MNSGPNLDLRAAKRYQFMSDKSLSSRVKKVDAKQSEDQAFTNLMQHKDHTSRKKGIESYPAQNSPRPYCPSAGADGRQLSEGSAAGPLGDAR